MTMAIFKGLRLKKILKMTDKEQRKYKLKITSLKETTKDYDDGDFYIWREENVDDEMLDDKTIVSVWLAYHPYDKIMF